MTASGRHSEAVADEVGERLLSTLRETTGEPTLAFDRAPEPLTGGFYARMLRFSLVGAPDGLAGELVARIVPSQDYGAWESTIQSYVADQGFPTPRVRLTANSSSTLGRFLIVMDHVEGHPLLAGLSFSTLTTQLPTLVRRLPDQLADMAARLHALDAEPLVRELRSLEVDVPLTATEYVERQALQAELNGSPELVRVGEHLLRTQPPPGRDVVTHGDLHPFNLLETATGSVLVDWTVALVAHPAFTLAFTELMLTNPPIPLPKAGTVALRRLGRLMARRFLHSYASLTAHRDGPLDPATLDWYRRVHALRILVELAGWDAAGQRPSGHPWLMLEPVARRELGLP